LLLSRTGYRFNKIDVTEGKKCPNCAYELSNDIIGIINKSATHRFSFL
jgi:hypothetical protein